MSRILQRVIFGIIFAAMMGGLKKLIDRSSLKDEAIVKGSYRIVYGKIVKGLVIAMFIIFGALMLVCIALGLYYKDNLESYAIGAVIFGVLWIFCVFGLMAILNWSLVVEYNQIKYRNMFGKEKTFYFEELDKAVIRNNAGVAVYSKGKKVMSFDSMISTKDQNSFLATLEEHNVLIEN